MEPAVRNELSTLSCGPVPVVIPDLFSCFHESWGQGGKPLAVFLYILSGYRRTAGCVAAVTHRGFQEPCHVSRYPGGGSCGMTGYLGLLDAVRQVLAATVHRGGRNHCHDGAVGVSAVFLPQE